MLLEITFTHSDSEVVEVQMEVVEENLPASDWIGVSRNCILMWEQDYRNSFVSKLTPHRVENFKNIKTEPDFVGVEGVQYVND